jgi:hypothetical protein
MNKLLLAAAIALIPITAHANSYSDGVKDWYSFKDWHDKLTGPYADGANYWISHRSIQHMTCEQASAQYTGNQPAYLSGCHDAFQRLNPVDTRRLSDMQYRLGFIDGSKNQVNVSMYNDGKVISDAPSAPPQTYVRNDYSSSSGHEWWMINFSSGYCERASVTPDQMQQTLRRDPDTEGVPDVRVTKNDDGTVFGVVIIAEYRNSQSSSWWFTTTPQGCQNVRAGLIEKGQMNDPRELP